MRSGIEGPARVVRARSTWLQLRHGSLSMQRGFANVVEPLDHSKSDQALMPAGLLRKEYYKQRRSRADHAAPTDSSWTLRIGVEIHAQLNTEYKLFSAALADLGPEDQENAASRTAAFDLGLPGAQPVLQRACLVPAIRAALALSCTVQEQSTFERKHYFYHDQPNGYQITQHDHPYAQGGRVTLETGEDIGIQQIQLEQDTAKTVHLGDDRVGLDFNRVGQPLIEIVSHPHLTSGAAAAAFVKQVQALLLDVNAVTRGMEHGGLRADVNVSVARKDHTTPGQRVEIKNLSTLQCIRGAVEYERQRQIGLLVNGEDVVGETRGWQLGGEETIRLRSKEGEVDYRYMVDADIPPLIIDQVDDFSQEVH